MADSLALAADFGSTYTKLRAVDLTDGRLVATAQSPTTVTEGLMVGLRRGLDLLGIGRPEFAACYGCSSAAGGLRIVAIGLVRSLTAEAACLAALGAGGKIIATYAGDLSRSDIVEILAVAPDLIVMSGGTDGGDRRCITGNAHRLAEASVTCPLVVAGNRAARADVSDALTRGGIEFTVVDNVLPSLEVLAPEACSVAIRDVFMRRIAHAKGLFEVEKFLGQGIIPTPNAALSGVTLLAEGVGGRQGLGDLLGIDVGGATTDVYSVSRGEPSTPRTTMRGLPEPYIKRTVEGDLGVRINAGSIVEVAGVDEVLARASEGAAGENSVESTELYARGLTADVSSLPANDSELSLDIGLAAAAAVVAARRHAGRLEQTYGPGGRYHVQHGKDLMGVQAVIGSGGVLSGTARSLEECARILAPVAFDESAPQHLLPRDATRYVDRDYVLFAAGLLSRDHREVAFELVRASHVMLGRVRAASAGR